MEHLMVEQWNGDGGTVDYLMVEQWNICWWNSRSSDCLQSNQVKRSRR